MAPKALMIVPYRDRKTHLSCLLLYMQKWYSDIRIVVSEQVDNGPWNKGLLFNAAYRELAADYDYLILADVDFIPVVGKVDYSPCEVPTMIAAEASQFNYQLTYPQFFGGVVVCSKDHYELVNGYSNQFKGYGGEDDLQHRSFIGKGIIPAIKNGRFECFAHPRPKRDDWYQHNLRVLGAGRDYSEGLSTANYSVTSIQDFPECIHLKVSVG